MRAPAAVLLATALALSGCLGAPGDDVDVNGTNDTSLEPGAVPDAGRTNGSEAPPPDTGSQNATNESPAPDQERPPPREEVPQPPWPSLGAARIRPGVELLIGDVQCTSNFLFRTPDNATLLIGTAAHCVADGAQNNVNGCDAANKPLPLGTTVRIAGASNPGVLVYSSWLAMQNAGDGSDAACLGNDFALVAIDASDRPAAHPAMLYYGGPTGLAEDSLAMGEKVLTYGSSGLRFGLEPTNPREGYVVDPGNAWTAYVETVTPGIPGDSGSGVITGDGTAVGTLSTISGLPPGANGVSRLSAALAYAQAHGLQVELVTWGQLDEGNLPG